jgi:flavin reductase (DIM6/NTAB) family NADH-FMN oxidoreductase RutF
MDEDGQNAAGKLVSVGLKDNFYQSSAFIPMSFGLVTTQHESGETGIGPHALLYPFGITTPHSMLLISRGNSGTAMNIRRTGRCALNYIEHDPEKLRGIVAQGYPGQSLADKQRSNPYTLENSPDDDSGTRPQVIAEACQVMECSWDSNVDIDGQLPDLGEATAAHFVLNIDRLLMRADLVEGIEDGSRFPNMPVFYGFRADGNFWFAEHAAPFLVPVPKVKGQELQAVVYLANRIDDRLRFTDEACQQLTAIPRPFLKDALKGIAETALELGIDQVDPAALEKISAQRQG